MGVDYTLHDHIAQTSLRLKNINSESICVSPEAAADLEKDLNNFLSQGFPSTGMEAISRDAFAHIDNAVEDLKGKGILSGSFQLEAIEISTPYDGTLDHPNTQVIFITDRVETLTNIPT